MAADVTIRVEDGVKAAMQALTKERYISGTRPSDIIAGLIRRNQQFTQFQKDVERERNEEEQKWKTEQRRQADEMLQIGKELMVEAEELKQKLGIKTDADFVRFMMIHFSKLESFDLETMLYLKSI